MSQIGQKLRGQCPIEKMSIFAFWSKNRHFFQFPEKLTEFVVQSLVSNVEKLEKNYGEIIFDLSLIVL